MKACIRKYFLLGMVALLSGTAPAYAQAVNKLTDNKVRNFYAELPELFKKPYEQFLQTYDLRIAPDLTYTSKTIINVPGQSPMQTEPVSMTKNDILGNARRAYDSAKGATLTNDIVRIGIAADGKSATVTSTSTVKGMNFPTSDGSPMKADSVETCEDVVNLTDGGSVQVLKSNCTADITILK